VLVDERSVRVKVSPGRAKVEFDDAARVAARTGRPVREVLADAEARWRASRAGAPLRLADEVAEPVDDRWTSGHAHPHDHDEEHDHPAGHRPGDEPA